MLSNKYFIELLPGNSFYYICLLVHYDDCSCTQACPGRNEGIKIHHYVIAHTKNEQFGKLNKTVWSRQHTVRIVKN